MSDAFDASAFSALASASREFHLCVGADGHIDYADERARRLLGVDTDGSLLAIAAPGSEGKLRELLRRAPTTAVTDWEVALAVNGKPLPVAFSTAPHGDRALLVGHVIPAVFAGALDRVNAMISEVTTLNRELARVNHELADSHRGVQTLLHELQDKADQTQRENEVKNRVVANLSHELRTPLHSILGLTQLLQSGVDGPLAPEHGKQVSYIRASASDLLALVNDVLDLGQLGAGQSHVRIEPFALADFIASMRGVLRPLVPEDSAVELHIDDAPTDGMLETDRTKLSQIVRNLVSNALKFTERGTVRVQFALEGERLVVTVTDTGIGIAAGDFERIFQEYGQLESHIQARVKGTGLGLPLAKRLAERLGGTLELTSEVGTGTTFHVQVPAKHGEAAELHALVERNRVKPPGAASILVVEDDRHTLFLYEKYLVNAGFHVMPARTLDEASALMKDHRPAAIVLDIMLEGDSSWTFLASLKRDPATQDIPVLVVTVTNREDKARALGADEFWLKPVDQDRLLRKLRDLAKTTPVVRVLVIDDDDTSRYIIRRHLEGEAYTLLEASTGADGIASARANHPNVILLDFLLDGCNAFDVIDELKADPRTRGIPVIVVTSQVLAELDQRRLLEEAEAVISKQNLSRELAINRIRDALQKTVRAHS